MKVLAPTHTRLQAVRSGDPSKLQQAQLNIAQRRAGIRTPVGATPAGFGTPGASLLRTPGIGTTPAAATPAMTPRLGINAGTAASAQKSCSSSKMAIVSRQLCLVANPERHAQLSARRADHTPACQHTWPVYVEHGCRGQACGKMWLRRRHTLCFHSSSCLAMLHSC